MSGLRRTAGRIRRALSGADAQAIADAALVEVTDEDRRYLTTFYDDASPLPPGAAEHLTPDNPGLQALREAYAASSLPVTDASRWNREAVEGFLDLRYFRGETLIVWHYRELPRITELKYFVYAQYVGGRDPRGYLGSLGEDGGFGCWTFTYDGLGRVSRDLLESVNELCFLDRELGLAERERFSVLDIGAGYGRLAHRMAAAHPGRLADYCCVDAVPESTFVCEYYLGARGVSPPARVVPLHRVEEELAPGSFDLAVNIHSFPEMPYAAVEWWAGLLARLEVPHLLVIPNEHDELRSLEPDGTRRDLTPVLERAGYGVERSEPIIEDPAVRHLLDLEDHFLLFTREG